MVPIDDSTHYLSFVIAYIRGILDLSDETDCEALLEAARQRGLRLFRFKRRHLPRVAQVIGMLKGLQPSDLLDVGTGRGSFLWPFLDQFPWVPVTCVENHPIRCRDLESTAKGGIDQISVRSVDVQQGHFDEQAHDIVTALEVLEHLPRPFPAVENLVKTARRYIVASVPSKPDDNPEHIHFFEPKMFESLFMSAGAQRVDLTWVPGHMIALVKVY
ncbi:Class I SAM-dependent methyltransferase [Sulfidibacter corallicola]